MKQKKRSVVVLIAALNEEKIIEKTVKETLKITQYEIHPIVVIDSKTTDNTKKVAENAGAKVIDTGMWQGKGAALRIAQKKIKGDFIVQMDADLQFLPKDIPRLLKPLESGYDVALGSRYEKGSTIEEGSVTNFRHFGIFFLSLATTIACRQKISDVLAGFKAFKYSVLDDLNMQVNHYGYEAELPIRAAQKGYKIINIAVEYRKRSAGKSNVIPLKHGLLFLETIITTALKKS